MPDTDSLYAVFPVFRSKNLGIHPTARGACGIYFWIIGGTYGIGGGAIIAPFCVAVFHLPVYTVAGAGLLGTFLTSIVGVVFYSALPSANGISTSPDWRWVFSSAPADSPHVHRRPRLQKFIPQKSIKIMLGLMIIFLALRYITQYFI